jgi:hypothetical protein
MRIAGGKIISPELLSPKRSFRKIWLKHTRAGSESPAHPLTAPASRNGLEGKERRTSRPGREERRSVGGFWLVVRGAI